MKRSFNSIVEELKLRIASIKSECNKYLYNGFDGDQIVESIQSLVDDFEYNLDDLNSMFNEIKK